MDLDAVGSVVLLARRRRVVGDLSTSILTAKNYDF